jgi:hypothetical protein
LGVDLGVQIADGVVGGVFASVLPWLLTRSHDIWVNCELIDGLDGAVIWQTELTRAADWPTSGDQLMTGFVEELAKRFPYRG